MKVSIQVPSLAAKLLVPCGDGSKTVGWLLEETEKRLLKKGHELKVIELQTDDQQSLDADDCINDLLEDGQTIIAIIEGAQNNSGGETFASAFVSELQKAQAERIFECVQCGQEYQESTNGEGHCAFHSGEAGWNYRYTCCYENKGSKPCKRGRHCYEHHTEFPYENYFTWASEIRKKASEKWIEISRTDYEDDTSRNLEVGIIDSGDLYIWMAQDWKALYCCTFSASKRMELASTTNPLIARRSGDGWFMETSWVIQSGAIVGIQVRSKMGCDTTITEKIVRFTSTLQDNSATKTQVVVVSAPLSYHFDSSVKYTFKPFEESGPKYLDIDPPTPKDYKYEGDSVITMKQEGSPFATQSTWARGEEFTQYINCSFTLINTSDQPISVVSCTSSVKLGDKFSDAEETNTGSVDRMGRMQIPRSGTVLPIKLEAQEAVKLSSQTLFSVKGQPGHDNITRNRAHTSLPQPLPIKTTFTDSKGKQVSMVVEQVNNKITLTSKDDKVDDWKHELTGWWQCDNPEIPDRMYVNASLEVVLHRGCQYFEFGNEFLEKVAYKAVKSGNHEYELENFNSEGSNDCLQVWLLVDIAHHQVYGIRVHMHTATSSLDVEVPLPDTQEMHKKCELVATPSEVKPGQTISVHWRVPVTEEDDYLCMYDANAQNGNYLDEDGYRATTTKEGTKTFTAPSGLDKVDFRFHPNRKIDEEFLRSNVVVILP